MMESSYDSFKEKDIKLDLEDLLLQNFKIQIYNLNSFSANYESGCDHIIEQNYLENYQEFEIIEISDGFSAYLKSNPIYNDFTNILTAFLINYFRNKDYKPKKCIFTLFNFPNEDYIEPMVKIIYPNNDKFDNLKIKDAIEDNFKVYLAKNSKSVEEFKKFRKTQQKFRLIIRRE